VPDWRRGGLMSGVRSRVDHLMRWLYEPKTRGIILQALAVIALLLVGYTIASNVAANLQKQNVSSGFGFLGRTSGFDISQKLIPYENTSTFGRAFWVGLLNTLLVSSLGIAFATILGFTIGLARLSSNWLIAKLALGYVEIVRNVPLLLQLLFWYFAALRSLPMPRDSLEIGLGAMLNRRGLYLPVPLQNATLEAIILAFIAAVVATMYLTTVARRQRLFTGKSFPAGRIGAGLMLVLPLAAYLLSGPPLTFTYPAIGKYNVEGGLVIQPEFAALLTGLSVYTAAFIAEIVRAGILGVPRGQREAATALGLSKAQALRLVIVPQALRIIVPPLTNQYLNLTKNSSLAVAIGYPDLVSVFSGTVLNLSNQAVEVILITMAVYLSLSLFTSLIMNRLNARLAPVGR
jgi:general L-amino acid transport system permease protein